MRSSFGLWATKRKDSTATFDNLFQIMEPFSSISCHVGRCKTILFKNWNGLKDSCQPTTTMVDYAMIWFHWLKSTLSSIRTSQAVSQSNTIMVLCCLILESWKGTSFTRGGINKCLSSRSSSNYVSNRNSGKNRSNHNNKINSGSSGNNVNSSNSNYGSNVNNGNNINNVNSGSKSCNSGTCATVIKDLKEP